MPDRQGGWGVEPLVTKLAASAWNVTGTDCPIRHSSASTVFQQFFPRGHGSLRRGPAAVCTCPDKGRKCAGG